MPFFLIRRFCRIVPRWKSFLTRRTRRSTSTDGAARRASDVELLFNELGQPIGEALPQWRGAQKPDGSTLTGRYCRLERVDVAQHAGGLHEAYGEAPDARDWTYLKSGPFAAFDAFCEHLASSAASTDPLHYTVIDIATGKALGTLALMRIDAPNGVIEVGFVTFSRRLQRTRVATEAIFLLMQYSFERLGYRRFEWKCDALNAPSRAAALRYGFTFEGIFRQAIVYRARNRDTAWHSIVDGEWPAICAGFNAWLAPDNFDAHGAQRHKLAELIAAKRA
jgi:RimJ/RimL family protein N-acetyltransferase